MKYSLTLVPQEEETSFEKILKYKKERNLIQVINKNAQPKRKIKMAGAIITSKEVSRQIIEKAEGKKAEEKTLTGKKKEKKRKKKRSSIF